MTPADIEAVVRWLSSLGLRVLQLDPETGTVLVQIPKEYQ